MVAFCCQPGKSWGPGLAQCFCGKEFTIDDGGGCRSHSPIGKHERASDTERVGISGRTAYPFPGDIDRGDLANWSSLLLVRLLVVDFIAESFL